MTFKVFPCDINKQPLVKWKTEASNDPEKIKQWMNDPAIKSRFAYWGLPTGSTNGLIALDIDYKPDRNGYASIQDHSLAVPPTLSQRSPTGGTHFLYKYPNGGLTYGNRVGIYPGVDARGEDGYVCVYGLDGKPINPAPEWLAKAAIRESTLNAGEQVGVTPGIGIPKAQQSIQTILAASEGERNDTLNREAFKVYQLVASGAVTKDWADSTLAWAAKEIGLDPSEIRATLGSSSHGGTSKPITSPFPNQPPTQTIPIPEPPQPEIWTPRRFEITDLLNTTKLKQPQLFKDWSTVDIHLTTADGGTGKTTLKLYEAICLALGERFLGFECLSPGKTLIITGEDSEPKLAAMIGQICKQMGILEDTAKMQTVLDSIIVKKDNELCLITRDKQGFYYPNWQAYEKVRMACDEIGPRMIVFDPISMFWGSESAVNDMAKAVAKFVGRLVHDTKACVEMINHIGKVSSNQKDMSQFAGRGGTGLPSHARVNRVMRGVDDEEYMDIRGKPLEQGESAIICNVAKFTDGSPLFNKPFLILRKGYLFERHEITRMPGSKEPSANEQDAVWDFVVQARREGKYPTETVVKAGVSSKHKMSMAAVERALQMLQFSGKGDKKLKVTNNPNQNVKEPVVTIVMQTDDDNEVIPSS